jgi:hypothetical protein
MKDSPTGLFAAIPRPACFTKLCCRIKESSEANEASEYSGRRPAGFPLQSLARDICAIPCRLYSVCHCKPRPLPYARKAYNTPILLRRTRFSSKRKNRTGKNPTQAPIPLPSPVVIADNVIKINIIFTQDNYARGYYFSHTREHRMKRPPT